jgi:hypothetical protein
MQEYTMGIMFQTFRPGGELSKKGLYLLSKWNTFSKQTRERIIKEMLGKGANRGQHSSKIQNASEKAANDARTDQN